MLAPNTTPYLERLGEILRIGAELVGQDRMADEASRQDAVADLEIVLEVLRRLALRLAREAPPPPTLVRVREVTLTAREMAIARLLVENRSYKEIAAELGLTPLSAQSRAKEIYMKLAVHSKRELRAAIELAEQLGEAPVEATAVE